MRTRRIPMLVCMIFLVSATLNHASAQKRGDDSRHASARGQVVKSLSNRHRVVNVKNRSFYVDNGVFYRKSGRNFVVIGAPAGAIVRTLPPRHATLRVGRRTY